MQQTVKWISSLGLRRARALKELCMPRAESFIKSFSTHVPSAGHAAVRNRCLAVQFHTAHTYTPATFRNSFSSFPCDFFLLQIYNYTQQAHIPLVIALHSWSASTNIVCARYTLVFRCTALAGWCSGLLSCTAAQYTTLVHTKPQVIFIQLLNFATNIHYRSNCG